MIEKTRQKLTLDRPAVYQIKVPGEFDARWAGWGRGLKVTAGTGDDGQPITVLTCSVDQAALLGLLRRLYSLGSPLLSVTCLGVDDSQRRTMSNDRQC